VAFAKFYWKETSRAAYVGDTSLLKTLYSPDCAPCKAYVDIVNKDIANGLRTDILATSIKKSTLAAKTDGKSDEAVSLTATDAAYELVDASGKSAGKTDPLTYRIIIYVDWEGGEWTVVDSYMIT
jgi:hypothetical protein